MDQIGSFIIGLGVLIAVAGLYFLPTIVAFMRQHHNTAVIAVLNLFLGWTVLGWIIFLAMAFSAVKTPPISTPAK